MKYLYNESNFNDLKKKKSHLCWFFVIDFALEAAIVLICLLLSNYHSKLVFSIVGSVLSIGVVFFLIYLIDRFKKLDHLIKEYEALLRGKEIIVEGETSNNNPAFDESVVTKDNFEMKVSEYADAQEMLLADPIHDVDEEEGWQPVFKEEDNKNDK